METPSAPAAVGAVYEMAMGGFGVVLLYGVFLCATLTPQQEVKKRTTEALTTEALTAEEFVDASGLAPVAAPADVRAEREPPAELPPDDDYVHVAVAPHDPGALAPEDGAMAALAQVDPAPHNTSSSIAAMQFPEVEQTVHQGSEDVVHLGGKRARSVTTAEDYPDTEDVVRLGEVCSPSTPFCVTFGGADGFGYDTASPEEQAAFRAVIMHYARPGDTVRIAFTPRTDAVFPYELERKESCLLWKRIDHTVVAAECVANTNYVRDFLLLRNKRHLVNLEHLTKWASQLPEKDGQGKYKASGGQVTGRSARTHPATLKLTAIEAAAEAENVVAPGDGSPYLTTLAHAQSDEGMAQFGHLIRAITNSCLTEITRDLDQVSIHGSGPHGDSSTASGTVYSYPRGQTSGDVELASEAFMYADS